MLIGHRRIGSGARHSYCARPISKSMHCSSHCSSPCPCTSLPLPCMTRAACPGIVHPYTAIHLSTHTHLADSRPAIRPAPRSPARLLLILVVDGLSLTPLVFG